MELILNFYGNLINSPIQQADDFSDSFHSRWSSWITRSSILLFCFFAFFTCVYHSQINTKTWFTSFTSRISTTHYNPLLNMAIWWAFFLFVVSTTKKIEESLFRAKKRYLFCNRKMFKPLNVRFMKMMILMFISEKLLELINMTSNRTQRMAGVLTYASDKKA